MNGSEPRRFSPTRRATRFDARAVVGKWNIPVTVVEISYKGMKIELPYAIEPGAGFSRLEGCRKGRFARENVWGLLACGGHNTEVRVHQGELKPGVLVPEASHQPTDRLLGLRVL